MTVSDQELLAEFRGKPCEWCQFIGDRPKPGDPAHLFHSGIGGGKQLDIRINLASICRLHHTASHAGCSPHQYELIALVAKRENVAFDFIVDEIRRLQRAEKDGSEPRRKGT